MAMYIRVKRHKTTYFVTCDPTDTVIRIKQKLQSLIDEPAAKQRLILVATDEILNDSKTLAEQKVENDAVVALTLKIDEDGDFEDIHAQTIVSGNFAGGDIATATKFIQRLCDLGGAAQARRLFAAIPNPDLFLFNVLIRSSALYGDASYSLFLYRRLLQEPDLVPDHFTFSFAAAAASSVGSDRTGRALHAHAIQSGHSADHFVGSAFANLYFNFGHVIYAEKTFDGIAEPDTVAWNTLVSGLARNGCSSKSVEAFVRLLADERVKVDTTSLAAVLPAAAELGNLNFGMTAHCLAMKIGLSEHNFVATALISTYSKCGDVPSSRFLFDEMLSSDLIAWNAMISGYSINGDVTSSVRLFGELLQSGRNPSSSTLGGLVPVYSSFGHEVLSCCIHGFAVKCGLESNSLVSTALITVYGRSGQIECARNLFEWATEEKSLASWNAVICGHAQNGETEEAVALFRRMLRAEDIRPNAVTVTSVLSACAQLGTISLGKWAHEVIREKQLEMNVFVSTALIDMYAKCGSIDQARRIFEGMPEKTAVSWNAMIAGYGLHGRGREALALLSEMLEARVAPTSVTYLAVLHACSHAGLVQEGRELYLAMETRHGIKPGAEHAACMVDLLGRAGKLQEAMDFISGLPEDPGPGVWGALLGGCMIHKDSKLATLASKRLFKLEPDSTGYYVLLSNIHSAEQDYKGAALIRQGVKSKRLTKTPGCTTIEMGGLVHTFTSGVTSHGRTAEIYRELERIAGKIAEAGYTPVTNNALYDVEEEEKAQMLRVHSEKLAICFGLISSEPGTEIRIIKNLRVCLDCHDATKYISKVTSRVIVVRDANRFHHFRDGVCSCGDYW